MLRLFNLLVDRGFSIGWSWRFAWTGYMNPIIIYVERKSRTVDGIFGTMTLNVTPFKCVTLENLDKSIPAGTYDLDFTYSPHFNRIMPHIIVPSRDALAGGDAGIRIHWANFPAQLDGCIAVGTAVDGDSIDESLIPFNQLWAILGQQKGIKINVLDGNA